MQNKKYTDINSIFYTDEGILTSTSIQAINNSIDNILFTKKGTKLGEPEFGTNIDQALFSQIDTITENILYNEIYDSLSKYEPRIIINSINIFSDADNNIYNIKIIYTVKKSPNNKYTYLQILKRL